MRRPFIVGTTVYLQPFAHNLHTGVRRMLPPRGNRPAAPWLFPHRYGGCGPSAASAHYVLYRNGHLAFLELQSAAVEYFLGIRPGCWINTIPAAGLVIQTEASSGCICDYSLQSTIVFAPDLEGGR